MSEEKKIVYFNGDIATKILDLTEEVVKELDAPDDIPVEFGELTADAGKLPRLMIAPQSTGEVTQRYISGETIHPFNFALYLHKPIMDEQQRLDAHAYLTKLTKAFLQRCQVLDGYVAFRKPTASTPVELGSTNAFEDWQVTVQLLYKQTK
ncbi:MAG: hypothetical protein ACLUY3_05725 [Eggerthellaceae bacterium]